MQLRMDYTDKMHEIEPYNDDERRVNDDNDYNIEETKNILNNYYNENNNYIKIKNEED